MEDRRNDNVLSSLHERMCYFLSYDFISRSPVAQSVSVFYILLYHVGVRSREFLPRVKELSHRRATRGFVNQNMLQSCEFFSRRKALGKRGKFRPSHRGLVTGMIT